MEKQKNKIIVLSGAGGSGKTTIAEHICKDDNFVFIPSTTSRKKREGEVDGKQYFFVSKKEFKQLIDDNQILEWVFFKDAFYGTNKKRILDNLKTKNCILVLDYVGAERFKKMFPNETITVFVFVEEDELKRRLILRGETKDNIEKRLILAKNENEQRHKFDFIVENKPGEAQSCANLIKQMVK